LIAFYVCGVWIACLCAEIQRLSGSVLFGWDLTHCAQSYPELCSAELWVSAEQQLRAACYLSLGVAEHSPLPAVLGASALALPKLVKFATLAQSHSHLIDQIQLAVPLRLQNGSIGAGA
jgi:hypothetical protein